MSKLLLKDEVNTVLQMTKDMVHEEGIEKIVSEHFYQFDKPKLDQLSLVNKANKTTDITKFSIKENVALKGYLNSLEEKIIHLGLLPNNSRQRFEKLSNLPMVDDSEFESTFELLLALQMKKVDFPFRYSIKTTYKNEKEQDTYIDFEVFTNEGPIYIVLSDFHNSNYFSCSNLAQFRRPRLQVKHALHIKKNHKLPIYIMNIDKALKSFYLDINQLIWEFDSSADVLSFDECIDAMSSIISPAIENTVH